MIPVIRRRFIFGFLAALALPQPSFVSASFESSEVPPSILRVDRLLILDPGHGGDDLGAVAGGKMEKDIALSIARKVKTRLEKLGSAPVRLTRDSDAFIPLDQRVNESRDANGLAFVSLHLNKVRRKKLHGITVYAFGKDRFHIKSRRPLHRPPPLAAPPKEVAAAGGQLAVSIVRSLRAQGLRVNPIERAAFYVLKNPSVPSVLIELGYLSNPKEAARLSDPAYQDRLAEALAVSLESYGIHSLALK